MFSTKLNLHSVISNNKSQNWIIINLSVFIHIAVLFGLQAFKC